MRKPRDFMRSRDCKTNSEAVPDITNSSVPAESSSFWFKLTCVPQKNVGKLRHVPGFALRQTKLRVEIYAVL